MTDLKDIAEEALRRYAVANGGNPHHFGKMAWDSYSAYLLAHGEALARGYLALLAERDALATEASEYRGHMAYWQQECMKASEERDRYRDALSTIRMNASELGIEETAEEALAQPPKPEPAEGT